MDRRKNIESEKDRARFLFSSDFPQWLSKALEGTKDDFGRLKEQWLVEKRHFRFWLQGYFIGWFIILLIWGVWTLLKQKLPDSELVRTIVLYQDWLFPVLFIIAMGWGGICRIRIMDGPSNCVPGRTEELYRELCVLGGIPSLQSSSIPSLRAALTIANIRNVMVGRAQTILRLKADYNAIVGDSNQARKARTRLDESISDAESEFKRCHDLYAKWGFTEDSKALFALTPKTL